MDAGVDLTSSSVGCHTSSGVLPADVEWTLRQPQSATTSIPAFVAWRDAMDPRTTAASLPYRLPQPAA